MEDSAILLTDIVNCHTILWQCTLSVLVVNEKFYFLAVVIYMATWGRRARVNAIVVECTIALACTCEELGEWLGHIGCVSQVDTRIAICPVCNVEITFAVHRHTSWVTEAAHTTLVNLGVLLSEVVVKLPDTTVLTSSR